MEYFYLVASLPKLNTTELNAEKDIENIKNHIQDQLEEKDQLQFKYLLYKNDNKNLLHILRKKEGYKEEPYFNFHKPNYFSYQELEAGINGDHPLPGYMKLFLRKYNGYEGRNFENEIIQLYYNEAIDNCGIFLGDYFQFKKNLKNIVSAINAKLFQYPLYDSLVGSGFVVDSIMKSNSADFGLGNHYPFIEEIVGMIRKNTISDMEKYLDQVLLNYLNSHTPISPFSEDAIFLYFIKLMIGNRWLLLDEDSGREELQRNLQWVVNSANYPLEYEMEGVI